MRIAAILIAAVLLSACAGAPLNPYIPGPDAPVWPAAPETPRVQYVTSITRPGDLYEPGNFLSSVIGIVAGEEDNRMVRPYAVVPYSGGGLVVTDPGLGRVHLYDAERRRYRALGEDLEGGLPSPVGVAVAPDGTILVADSRRRTIERFDRNGRSLGAFAKDYEFQRPGGMAIHPDTGRIYATDITRHSVVVFTPGGEVEKVLGGNGAAPREFNFPTHISFDAEGSLLVADSMNFRIQRISAAGEVLSVYGEAGNARGDFARPKGIASPAGGVYAAVEGLYDSLVFFNEDGELLMSLGQAGAEKGQFWLAAGLHADRERNLIFVADTYNSRVQVFRMLSTNDGGGGEPTQEGEQP